MGRRSQSLWFLLAAMTLAGTALAACTTPTRPPEPMRGERVRLPEGAVSIHGDAPAASLDLEDQLATALVSRFAGALARDERGNLSFAFSPCRGVARRGRSGPKLAMTPESRYDPAPLRRSPPTQRG